jgi:anti-anti-sigma factor
MRNDKPQLPNYEISEKSDGGITLHIQGSINTSNAASLIRELRPILEDRNYQSMTVDLEKATYLDDYGVLALSELREIITKGEVPFQIENAGNKVKEILSILDFDSPSAKRPLERKRPSNIFIRFGEDILKLM